MLEPMWIALFSITAAIALVLSVAAVLVQREETGVAEPPRPWLREF